MKPAESMSDTFPALVPPGYKPLNHLSQIGRSKAAICKRRQLAECSQEAGYADWATRSRRCNCMQRRN